MWFSRRNGKLNSLVKDLSYLSKTSEDSIWTLDTLYHFKIIISQLQLTSFQQLDMNCRRRMIRSKMKFWLYSIENSKGEIRLKSWWNWICSVCVYMCMCICIESRIKCCWRKSFKRTRVPMVLPLTVLWMQQQILYSDVSLSCTYIRGFHTDNDKVNSRI